MRLLAVVIALFGIGISVSAPARSQVTSNVLRRVLEIRVGGGDGIQGSAFTFDVDGREYLVTAKHMVAHLKDKDKIEIAVRTNQWDSIDVAVYRCDGQVDVAVLVPSRQLTVNFPLDPTDGLGHDVSDGQDMYFVGFPFGQSAWAVTAYSHRMNGDYPIPLVKKAVFSGSFEREHEPPVILLDGFNAHGFSGGPIVYRDLNAPNAWTFRVMGVISGFEPDLVHPVKDDALRNGEDISKIEGWRLPPFAPIPPGHILRDTEQLVPLNSGIVVGYSISFAVDLINKHPEGPKTKSDFQ